MGAPIITGAARATVATGREAVAVAEAGVAALLADGARRRRTVLADIIINVYEIGRIKFEMDINIEINEYLILIIKNYISHRRRKYSCRRLMCSMS